MYHSTLGSRVIKKKKHLGGVDGLAVWRVREELDPEVDRDVVDGRNLVGGRPAREELRFRVRVCQHPVSIPSAFRQHMCRVRGGALSRNPADY